MTLTPKDKVADVHGLALHYLDWGSRDSERTLVCLHGTSGNAHHIDALAQSLLGSYRVIALDQRGHGLSDKPAQGYDAVNLAADLEDVAYNIGYSTFGLYCDSLG